MPQNNNVRWVLAHGRVFHDKQGEPDRFPGVVIDITMRKNNEEALKEADRRKDEFLATLAHELRNPLAPISYALQIMRLHKEEETHKNMEDVIDRQLQHMVRLVDDLMDISRITRGKIELQQEKTLLSTILEQAIETVQPVIEERQQELKIQIPDTPICLNADKTRLAQVFANILHNAAKYTQIGGQISLNTRIEKNAVKILIVDNGMGIPKDQLLHIFDMFAQTEPSLSHAQGGLGIGLTLVRQLVLMHGGTVEAQSEGMGKGSCFTICLPLLQNNLDKLNADNNSGPSDKLGKTFRVLVVDDNEEVADTLGKMLELLDHSVKIITEPGQVVDTAKTFAPDFILLDIGMPEIDGYALCKKLKKLPELAHTKLIAQTGWSEKRHLARSEQAGFDYHLAKPINFATLEEILK
jgi:CheY-like chemotaxis protein